MQRLLFLLSLAAGLLALTPTDVAARGGVLSLRGQITADGVLLKVGANLDATKKLALRPGATLQALIREGIHLALVGEARVGLRPDGIRVHQARALEVSARAGTIWLPGGHQALIEPPGATLRYGDGSLQILWGELALKRACPPALAPSSSPSSLPSSLPTQCKPRETLRSGSRVALKKTSPQLGPSLLRELSRHQPPPRWVPALAITLADLDDVQQWVAAKRRRQQELAACGCTEGASSGIAGTNPQQGSISPIENNAATLWISIKGLPPKVTP